MQQQINKNLFKGQSFYIGIDVHKKSWKVTILSKSTEHKTFSQNPDPKILAKYMNRHFPGGDFYAVYEAGFSGFESCRQLMDLGIHCKVIHPADVPTSQKERDQKSDKADSRKLAKCLRSQEFNGIHIPERILEADRALIRQRFKLVKDIARVKNRIKSLLFQFDISIPDQFTSAQSRYWSKVYIDWLKNLEMDQESLRSTLDNYIDMGQVLRKKLLEVNKQMRELSRSPKYEHKCGLLLSIPGIGINTAMMILTQLGDIKRFVRLDELCSYIGLIPKMHSSGDKTQTGKMTRRGRKELKIMMIEASWEASRKDPALMICFENLKQRMKKNKAIIRIARKLVSRIRYVLIHEQEYELGIV